MCWCSCVSYPEGFDAINESVVSPLLAAAKAERVRAVLIKIDDLLCPISFSANFHCCGLKQARSAAEGAEEEFLPEEHGDVKHNEMVKAMRKIGQRVKAMLNTYLEWCGTVTAKPKATETEDMKKADTETQSTAGDDSVTTTTTSSTTNGPDPADEYINSVKLMQAYAVSVYKRVAEEVERFENKQRQRPHQEHQVDDSNADVAGTMTVKTVIDELRIKCQANLRKFFFEKVTAKTFGGGDSGVKLLKEFQRASSELTIQEILNKDQRGTVYLRSPDTFGVRTGSCKIKN